MPDDLGRLTIARKSLGVDLIAFCRWRASDLVDNTMRGVSAEFIVAKGQG
jgi:hypothetical protein